MVKSKKQWENVFGIFKNAPFEEAQISAADQVQLEPARCWGRGFPWFSGVSVWARFRSKTVEKPHRNPTAPYQTPTRIHTEARAGAAPTRPTTRPPQIDKCATGGGRRANGGAFADLGRPVVDISGPGFSHGLSMVCAGFVVGLVVGLWTVCGRFVVGPWSDCEMCPLCVVLCLSFVVERWKPSTDDIRGRSELQITTNGVIH